VAGTPPGPSAWERAEVVAVYTRSSPTEAGRGAGRLTVADLPRAVLPEVTAYMCGSAGFADAASRLLVAHGVPVERIRVERFGPTG
jgi:ferredoxin-NADP reductase